MKGEFVSVEGLIHQLLKCDMGWKIEVRDMNNKKIRQTKIVAIKPEGLVCLFG